MNKNKHQIAIIGAGPAGISSAIYIKRAGYEPVIYENLVPGGKINNTSIVNNYPGIISISGPDLAYKFYEELNTLNTPLISQKVEQIIPYEDGYIIHTNEEDNFYHAIIIASGTKEKELNVPGFKEFIHKGISFCAVCDGPLYAQKHVAVVGGGNSALEEAIYLSSICEKVIVIHRHETFKADYILQEQLSHITNISLEMNSEVIEIKGHNRVESIVIRNTLNQSIKELDVVALFPYVGALANTDFINDLSLTDEKGYLIVDKDGQTKLQGIFGAGDVIKKDLRQIVIAASEGAIAGVSAAKYMKKNNY